MKCVPGVSAVLDTTGAGRPAFFDPPCASLVSSCCSRACTAGSLAEVVRPG
jgi:hypothetical protein